MKSMVFDTWLQLRASYWFVPSVMAFGALLVSLVLIQADTVFGTSLLTDANWLYANQPDGAQALLSTIAGSMITVAGVTFSITLLAISYAAAQIGPSLLSGFMRDRGNQITLGTFIATFLYCLMVLRTVRTSAGKDGADALQAFVPHLAILGAMIMAVVSVMVLIYYIHHVPQSINVSHVIERVGAELANKVCSIYPERIGLAARDSETETSLPETFAAQSRRIALSCDGYLRVVDTEGLMTIATKHDLVLQLHQRPGNFALHGHTLMRVWPSERLNDEIEAALSAAFSWGTERTLEQDVLLPVEQLLEIMGKALSPGINDQRTSLLCVDQLERALALTLRRRVADSRRLDEDHHLRVVMEPVTHEEFLHAVFRPMRQYVHGDWIATNHVLKALGRLSAMEDLQNSAPLLLAEAAAINADAQESTMTQAQKALTAKLYDEMAELRGGAASTTAT